MTNKRLKSWNYTEKRAKLQKATEKAIAENKITTKAKIAESAGYIKPNKSTQAPIVDMVEEIYPVNDRLERTKELGKDRNDKVSEKSFELETIKELNRISGIYAPEKTENINLNLNNDLSDEEEELLTELIEDID